MIDLNPSRFDMTTASPHRDWFEFILDFSLLDRHLLTDQPGKLFISLLPSLPFFYLKPLFLCFLFIAFLTLYFIMVIQI